MNKKRDNKRNPIAKDLRTQKYAPRIIQDARCKSVCKECDGLGYVSMVWKWTRDEPAIGECIIECNKCGGTGAKK